MYRFKLLEDEQVELVSDDALLKYKDRNLEVSVMITTKRMILFSYPMELESFRFGKMISLPLEKEVLLEVLLDDIKYIDLKDDYDQYILNDENYFYIFDEKIRNSKILDDKYNKKD